MTGNKLWILTVAAYCIFFGGILYASQKPEAVTTVRSCSTLEKGKQENGDQPKHGTAIHSRHTTIYT